MSTMPRTRKPKPASNAAAQASVPAVDDPFAPDAADAPDEGAVNGADSGATPAEAQVARELLETDLAEFFGPDGPLAQTLEGYELRPSQLEMAQAVKRALASPAVALIEAPTGTGKSIAYLLPAILSGKTVVVATANKSLQHQLFSKDIPFLRKVLQRDISAVVVKGRSNFVCTHKWEKELQEQRYITMYDREDNQVGTLRSWLEETDTGDIDDLPFVLNADLRPRVVSFADDCLHNDCRHNDDGCWVNWMRDRAAQAQILITNHHLLLNALELGYGGERILPPASVYVIDEAHQLEQTATSVYETNVTDYVVEQLLARTVFRDQVDAETLDALRLQNTLAFQEAANLSRDNSFRIEVELEQMRRLANLLRDLAQKLKDRNPYASGSGTAELNVYEPEERRAGKRSQKAKPKQASGEAGAGDEAEQRRTYELAIEALGSTATKLLTISSNKRDDDFVRFAVRVFDRRHISLELHAAPINPAAMLTKHLFHPINEEGAALSRTVICTSATLATHGAFEHFKARCGIETTGEEWVLPAVFDYPRQALLYQPPLPPFNFKQPDPYYDGVAQEIARLIEVSRGRTLCLFTSWSGLQQVNDRLQQPGNEVIWPLRAQGDAPRNALLTWFKETPHSVLLATRSFWEGVDIPGDDLSLVVMDKLPFPTPNDPLHSARATAIDEAGGSSFGEYSLPLMTLTLKQGFGRLIRRATDQGVVAILDERLSSKSYGKQARQDLPAARFCREFKDVHRFFQTGLETDAEFALNVWATPALSPKLAGLEVGGATGVRWRWQLLRLVDGKADRADGVLHGVEPPQAELHAAIAGLMDLKRRIEGAKRSPNDFTVEVRCSPAAAELALTGKTPAWGEARRVWGGLHFVWLERPLSAGG